MLCLPRNLHLEVHKVLHLSRILHVEVHKVLRLSRNLHFEAHKVLCLPRKLQRSHMWKSYDATIHWHLSRNQSTSTITTSKVLHLLRNMHFEVKPLRPLAPVTKSRLWTTPATKSDHHVRKCARHHNESAGSTCRRPPDSASLRSRSAHGRCREA